MPNGINRIIAAKVESVWGTAAGTGSAKKYRRTAFNVNYKKDFYQSREMRDDQQRVKPGTGGARVEGTMAYELSGGSHQAFFEAHLRAAAAAVANITSLTLDVAGSGPTYTITRSGGSWISDGVRIGRTVRCTAGLLTANKNRNLIVTALTALIMTVYPTDGSGMTAETGVSSCTVTVPGKTIVMPSTGHTETSFTVEDLMSATQSRLFTGVELGQLALDFTPGQNATGTSNVVGRGQTLDTTGYFSSPTALSTTPLLSGPRGILLINGAVQAVVTQASLNLNGNLTTDAVLGSIYAPAIGQGPMDGTGQVTIQVVDNTFLTNFSADTGFELLVWMAETGAANAEFMSFHVADCLLSAADIDDVPGKLKHTLPFGFYKKATTTGYESTSMEIQDSQYA